MKWTVLILMTFFSLALMAVEQPAEIVKRYDNLRYLPQNFGLTKMTLDLEIKGLATLLNNQKSYGPIKKIIFKLSLSEKREWRIDIEGMPTGFLQKKDQLKLQALGYLEWLTPSPLQILADQFNLKEEKSSDGVILKGPKKDMTGTIREATLLFDSEGLLKSYSYNKGDSVALEFTPVPNLSKKYVIKSITTIPTDKKMPTTITSITYKSVSGFMLPETIETKMVDAAKKEYVLSAVTLKNYKVNQVQKDSK